jgi:hypothetical protein
MPIKCRNNPNQGNIPPPGPIHYDFGRTTVIFLRLNLTSLLQCLKGHKLNYTLIVDYYKTDKDSFINHLIEL